ncbi:MAG: O-antigen ligase family protein [Tatlockia sp.]|nr:O-antigen ligase family protein [Tatlockia sp.]
MNFPTLQKKIEFLLPLWFGLLFFLTQISTALKSIPLMLVVISIFFLPNVGAKFIQVIKTRWCQAALLLFAVACLACFWGPAPTYLKLSTLKQYNKVLYLPILAIGLSYPKNRIWAIKGFLSAMVLTAFLSIGAYYEIFHSIQYDNVFLNHIMTGFAMSFAAFLALYYSLNSRGKSKIVYFGLFFLFTFHLFFVNLGRTGYLIYALMLGLFFLMYLPWKKCLPALLILGGLLAASYTFSPSMKTGLKDAVSGYRHYHDNKNTSVGYRMQFHSYAADLFKRHPLLGNGTSSFPVLFYLENPVPEFGRDIHEPHGIYWLVASEFGIVGLVALLWFFGSLLFTAFKLESMRIPAVIFISSFIVVNLSDSLLYYSGSGYLFILFAALYLSERIGVSENLSFRQAEHLTTPLGILS